MHTVSGVKPCRFQATADGWLCADCGRIVRIASLAPPAAACGRWAGVAAPPRPAEPPQDLARTDAPSFLTKVKNFAVASAKHVAAGMPMASDEEIIRRHDICTGCEFFKDNACQKCGCPVVRAKQYVSKLSWADSECPVGKWGKELPAGVNSGKPGQKTPLTP